jgi:hypothetical protein
VSVSSGVRLVWLAEKGTREMPARGATCPHLIPRR